MTQVRNLAENLRHSTVLTAPLPNAWMGYQRPTWGISASAGGWWLLGWPPAALASLVLGPVILAGAANPKVQSKKKTRACKNMIEERRPALGGGNQAWCFIRKPLCMRRKRQTYR